MPRERRRYPRIWFKLFGEEDGTVVAAVAAPEATEPIPKGKIVKMHNSGKIYRYKDVSPETGIALDEQGAIKVTE